MEHGSRLVSSITVVDNGSTDASIEQLGGLGVPLKLIRNSENRGFGAACNQGAESGNAKYVLFLNPDTRLFNQSLERPRGFMEDAKNANVGICGVQMVDKAGAVVCSCSRFPTLHGFVLGALGLDRLGPLRRAGIPMREWDHESTQEVDQVIGAFFFMRRSVFAALGGFDPRFFVYFEEVDLALRARESGWRSVFIADARIFHEGGGTTRQVKARRLFYSLRSRLLYGYKHFSRPKAWALLCSTVLVEPWFRAASALIKEGFPGCRNTLSGYRMLYHALPEVVASRKLPPSKMAHRI